ncbi:hypothetical protein ACJRO7_028116 [Eucalyptus globulus]|uniref:Leucine-rich repeat-containing N-terminal plant-type domain-containing protein n=1 Tax=Eucalyptus globulus TaxID=34317 RepID=A0ABD3K699_EUCGL
MFIANTFAPLERSKAHPHKKINLSWRYLKSNSQFHSRYLLLVLMHNIPSLASSQSSIAGVTSETIGKETEALLKWKSNLNEESRFILSSWNESSLCSWLGIACDLPRSIVSLNLSSSTIRGTLHHLNFSQLPSLITLKLSNNSLYGNIPPSIGNLSKLTYLDLSQNHLSGHIPAQLASLELLQVLDISQNSFTGPVPSHIGSLNNLSGLYLSDNKLSGFIPKAIGILKSLNYLYLMNNLITGPIPSSTGNMSSLWKIWLFRNQLVGPIPKDLGMLGSLSQLDFSSNNLNGSIPTTLGNLSNLAYLYLYNN